MLDEDERATWWSHPFNSATLGVFFKEIVGRFLDRRPDGCPHRGVDFALKVDEIDTFYFKAGFWALVVEPYDIATGTVTLRPFFDRNLRVRFVHCADVRVAPGEVVAPFTPIGRFTKHPPEPVETDLPFLHVEMERTDVKVDIDCWERRGFFDPLVYGVVDNHSLINGQWNASWSGRDERGLPYYAVRDYHMFLESPFSLRGPLDPNPGPVSFWGEGWDEFTHPSGCKFTMHLIWIGGVVVGYSGNKILLKMPNVATSCKIVKNSCPFTVVCNKPPEGGDGFITLLSSGGAQVGEATATWMGFPSKPPSTVSHITAPDADVEAGYESAYRPSLFRPNDAESI